MSERIEETTYWDCDVCDEEIETKHTPYHYKGKHFCESCIKAISEGK